MFLQEISKRQSEITINTNWKKVGEDKNLWEFVYYNFPYNNKKETVRFVSQRNLNNTKEFYMVVYKRVDGEWEPRYGYKSDGKTPQILAIYNQDTKYFSQYITSENVADKFHTAKIEYNDSVSKPILSNEQIFLHQISKKRAEITNNTNWKKVGNDKDKWEFIYNDFPYNNKKENVKFVSFRNSNRPKEFFLVTYKLENGVWAPRYGNKSDGSAQVLAAFNQETRAFTMYITSVNVKDKFQTAKIAYEDDRFSVMEQIANQTMIDTKGEDIHHRQLVEQVFGIDENKAAKGKKKKYPEIDSADVDRDGLVKQTAKNILYGSIYGLLAFKDSFVGTHSKEQYRTNLVDSKFGFTDETVNSSAYQKIKDEVVNKYFEMDRPRRINFTSEIFEFNEEVKAIKNICENLRIKKDAAIAASGLLDHAYAVTPQNEGTMDKRMMDDLNAAGKITEPYAKLASEGAGPHLAFITYISPLASLWATKTFENAVGHFDASDCVHQGKNYELGQIHGVITKEAEIEMQDIFIDAINRNVKIMDSGAGEYTAITLRKMIRSAPLAVRTALQQRGVVIEAAYVGQNIQTIYTKDKWNNYVDKGIMAAGFAVGILAGAVSGGTLGVAVFCVMATVDVVSLARGAYQWYDAYFIDDKIRQSMVSGQIGTDQAQDALAQAKADQNAGKLNVVMTVGANAVGYGIGKVITSSVKSEAKAGANAVSDAEATATKVVSTKDEIIAPAAGKKIQGSGPPHSETPTQWRRITMDDDLDDVSEFAVAQQLEKEGIPSGYGDINCSGVAFSADALLAGKGKLSCALPDMHFKEIVGHGIGIEDVAGKSPNVTPQNASKYYASSIESFENSDLVHQRLMKMEENGTALVYTKNWDQSAHVLNARKEGSRVVYYDFQARTISTDSKAQFFYNGMGRIEIVETTQYHNMMEYFDGLKGAQEIAWNAVQKDILNQAKYSSIDKNQTLAILYKAHMTGSVTESGPDAAKMRALVIAKQELERLGYSKVDADAIVKKLADENVLGLRFFKSKKKIAQEKGMPHMSHFSKGDQVYYVDDIAAQEKLMNYTTGHSVNNEGNIVQIVNVTELQSNALAKFELKDGFIEDIKDGLALVSFNESHGLHKIGFESGNTYKRWVSLDHLWKKKQNFKWRDDPKDLIKTNPGQYHFRLAYHSGLETLINQEISFVSGGATKYATIVGTDRYGQLLVEVETTSKSNARALTIDEIQTAEILDDMLPRDYFIHLKENQKIVWEDVQKNILSKYPHIDQNRTYIILYKAHMAGESFPANAEKLKALVTARQNLETLGYSKADADEIIRKLSDEGILGKKKPPITHQARLFEDEYGEFTTYSFHDAKLLKYAPASYYKDCVAFKRLYDAGSIQNTYAYNHLRREYYKIKGYALDGSVVVEYQPVISVKGGTELKKLDGDELKFVGHVERKDWAKIKQVSPQLFDPHRAFMLNDLSTWRTLGEIKEYLKVYNGIVGNSIEWRNTLWRELVSHNLEFSPDFIIDHSLRTSSDWGKFLYKEHYFVAYREGRGFSYGRIEKIVDNQVFVQTIDKKIIPLAEDQTETAVLLCRDDQYVSNLIETDNPHLIQTSSKPTDFDFEQFHTLTKKDFSKIYQNGDNFEKPELFKELHWSGNQAPVNQQHDLFLEIAENELSFKTLQRSGQEINGLKSYYEVDGHYYIAWKADKVRFGRLFQNARNELFIMDHKGGIISIKSLTKEQLESVVLVSEREVKIVASFYPNLAKFPEARFMRSPSQQYFQHLTGHRLAVWKEVQTGILSKYPNLDQKQVMEILYEAHIKGNEWIPNNPDPTMQKKRALVKARQELQKLGVSEEDANSIITKLADEKVMVLGVPKQAENVEKIMNFLALEDVEKNWTAIQIQYRKITSNENAGEFLEKYFEDPTAMPANAMGELMNARVLDMDEYGSATLQYPTGKVEEINVHVIFVENVEFIPTEKFHFKTPENRLNADFREAFLNHELMDNDEIDLGNRIVTIQKQRGNAVAVTDGKEMYYLSEDELEKTFFVSKQVDEMMIFHMNISAMTEKINFAQQILAKPINGAKDLMVPYVRFRKVGHGSEVEGYILRIEDDDLEMLVKYAGADDADWVSYSVKKIEILEISEKTIPNPTALFAPRTASTEKFQTLFSQYQLKPGDVIRVGSKEYKIVVQRGNIVMLDDGKYIRELTQSERNQAIFVKAANEEEVIVLQERKFKTPTTSANKSFREYFQYRELGPDDVISINGTKYKVLFEQDKHGLFISGGFSEGRLITSDEIEKAMLVEKKYVKFSRFEPEAGKIMEDFNINKIRQFDNQLEDLQDEAARYFADMNEVQSLLPRDVLDRYLTLKATQEDYEILAAHKFNAEQMHILQIDLITLRMDIEDYVANVLSKNGFKIDEHIEKQHSLMAILPQHQYTTMVKGKKVNVEFCFSPILKTIATRSADNILYFDLRNIQEIFKYL